MIRLTRHILCCCSVTLLGLGMGSQRAYGQGAIYVVPAGADPNDFGDGPTVIDARELRGSSIALEFFVKGVQVPVKFIFGGVTCVESKNGGGSVAYLEASGRCDASRCDYLFDYTPCPGTDRSPGQRVATQCVTIDNACPGGPPPEPYGVLEFLAGGSLPGLDIADGAPRYFGEFSLDIAADACGVFAFPLVETAVFDDDLMPIPEVAFHELIIALEPMNDFLGLASRVWNGTFDFDTLCASTDGPPGCRVDRDLWYEWTASCAGTLVVEAPGAQIGIYGPGLMGPPTDADEVACDLAVLNTIAVRPGETYLIRVGTLDGAPLAGTLTIQTEASERYADFVGTDGVCVPDGIVDLSDILMVLDMFRGDLATKCGQVDVDIAGQIAPTMDRRTSCIPDGKIDLFDIIAVLDAFQGIDACCGTP